MKDFARIFLYVLIGVGLLVGVITYLGVRVPLFVWILISIGIAMTALENYMYAHPNFLGSLFTGRRVYIVLVAAMLCLILVDIILGKYSLI